MKILYLTDQVFLHGGIEKVLSMKANYLADVLGEEVFIITHNQKENQSVYDFSSKITFFDLKINYIEGLSYFHPRNLLKTISHKKALKQTIKKINPDVIISCSFGPDFYFLPEIEKQIPKIKEFHSSRYFEKENLHSFRKKMQKKKTVATEKKYHALVVLNDDEKAFYNNQNVYVIPNPVEKSDYNADYSSKKIVAAGRLSPVKNFEELISIFSMVHQDFPDWQLHIYGEDYLETASRLIEQIKQLGLENQVKLMKTTPNLKKTMQDYSIYAMTSHTECFPMVLLESLSVGLPVISYDCPTGPKHIVKDSSDSFLISNKKKDIFVEKLRQLMQDETLREKMGKQGMENVEKFNIEFVMNEWQRLFNKIITTN